MVLASIFLCFSTPRNIKNWAPASARIKFCSLDTLWLKFTFVPHFVPQKVSKIEPKKLQNPFKNQLNFSLKLNVDFEPNLEVNLGSTWAPRGVQNDQNRCLKGYPVRCIKDGLDFTQKIHQNEPNLTPKVSQTDPNVTQNDAQSFQYPVSPWPPLKLAPKAIIHKRGAGGRGRSPKKK